MRSPRLDRSKWLCGKPALLGLLLAYFALAALYDFSTPMLEASDEFKHFFAIHELSQTHQLPVLGASPKDPYSPGQEAGQPPLYYLAASLISGWVDASDARSVMINPHAAAGIPSTSPDNKNLVVHTSAEDFPFHGISLAVHVSRVLSMVLGAMTVYLTYKLAGEIAPEIQGIGLLAAAVVAFNPQFLFVSASVDNDGLITAVCTAGLLLLARMLLRPPSRRALIGLSAILGLATLSKLSGLALPALAVLVVCGRDMWKRLYRKIPEDVAILAAGPLLISGWWYARNWLLYGEPTGLTAWVRLIGGLRKTPAGALTLLADVPGLFESYWGVFGAFNIVADNWVYFIYLSLCLLGLAGLLAAWRTGMHPRGRGLLLLVAWFGIDVAALARWTLTTAASTGRLLFPAIGAAATLLAVGLLAGVRPKWRGQVVLGVAALMLALAVFVPVRYIAPAYAQPRFVRSPAELGAPTHAADVNYDNKLELFGYDLSPEAATPGQEVTARLYWKVIGTTDRNYSVTTQLLGPDGATGQYDSFPGEGRIATRLLRPGQYFSDVYRFRIDAHAPTPLRGRLKVGVYDFFDASKPLQAFDGSGHELAEPVIGDVLVQSNTSRSAQAPAIAHFGGQIDLLASHLSSSRVRAGEAIAVDVRWRAAREMSTPYTVFLHLTDSTGQPVAQFDSQPRGGAYPTSWWAPGEAVADSLHLPIPPGTPPGAYRLRLGIYRLESLQRLELSTGGDSYDLGRINVMG